MAYRPALLIPLSHLPLSSPSSSRSHVLETSFPLPWALLQRALLVVVRVFDASEVDGRDLLIAITRLSRLRLFALHNDNDNSVELTELHGSTAYLVRAYCFTGASSVSEWLSSLYDVETRVQYIMWIWSANPSLFEAAPGRNYLEHSLHLRKSHTQYNYGPIPLLPQTSLHSLAETESWMAHLLYFTGRIYARVVSSEDSPRTWINMQQTDNSPSKKGTDYGAEANANMEWKDMTGRCCEVFDEEEQEDKGLKSEMSRMMAMAMWRGYT
ncbi:uncharacterized protein EV420DRAFT_1479433 [Desarmillaria tabescens]|uniref:Uncharacterized protein n=1 Tax=Armillaria tabescens TaxID=1929756 RepID=A0AA39KCR9_ARMTA|nr:uncharacterized protein EV420DRAFT_1479433 [Desarmillaria tabescens]KAK0458740.1 hypothetical protein EV420DRAFT_1479433 [Desarmillaria tabescens]